MTNLQAKPRQVLTVLAPAKLNLSLQILGKREDNYHEISTVFQSVDLCDSLHFTFSPADKGHLEIRLHEGTACDDFPLDDSNIIKKAAAVFYKAAPAPR